MRYGAILLILMVSLTGCKKDGASSPAPEPTAPPSANLGRTCNYFGSIVPAGGTVSGYLSSSVSYGQVCQRITASCDGNTGNLSSLPVQYCSIQPPKTCSHYGTILFAGQTVSGYASVSVPYGSTCEPVTGTCSGATGTLDITPENTCVVQAPKNCVYSGTTYTPGQTIAGFMALEVPYGQTCTAVTGTCSGATGQFDTIPPVSSCVVLPANTCTFNGRTLQNGESITAFDQSSANGKFCAEGQEVRTCNNGILSGSFTNASCSENPMTLRIDVKEGDTTRVFIAKTDRFQFSKAPRIDWGDGTYSNVDYYIGASTVWLPSHKYAAAGNYPIRILGEWKRDLGNYLRYYNPDGVEVFGLLPLVSQMHDNDNTIYASITEVSSWGDNKIDSFANMFFGEHQMRVLPATGPDMSLATNMDYMFAHTEFNVNLPFDTSTITSMKGVFWATKAFNKPLNWNVGNVTTMQDMFNNAVGFAQPINFSNSAQLTNVKRMFKNAIIFNQSLILNTSKVVDTVEMFMNAQSFNQPLNFNTISVTNMNGMFDGAYQFNQMLNFNTSRVAGMDRMFNNALNFKQDISFWCVPAVGMSEPVNFDNGTSPLWLEAMKPHWGTCPNP
jgi:hypothetical protein